MSEKTTQHTHVHIAFRGFQSPVVNFEDSFSKLFIDLKKQVDELERLIPNDES